MGVSAYLTCFIPNLFNRSLMYLFWLIKILSLVCLICNPIKKFNSLIKLILNLFYMHFANSLQRYLLVALNIISSTYIYISKISLPFSICEKGGVNLPMLKSLSIRKDFNISYHVFGSCFKPYKAFLSLKT